jgi:hypothetical protein
MYPVTNIIRIIKSKRMGWTGYVSRIRVREREREKERVREEEYIQGFRQTGKL